MHRQPDRSTARARSADPAPMRALAATLGALLAAALLIVAAPARAETVAVADLEVETGLVELDGTEAGTFWAAVNEDLSDAISARLDGTDTPGGAHVRVRIDGVALRNAYDMMQTGNVPFLDGRVTVIGPTMSDSRQLRISAVEDQGGSLPDGQGAKYTALVDGFAAGVVDVLR